MSGPSPGGLLGVLIDYGPAILVVSVLLVAASLVRRRRSTAVAAITAGALLYWGMYAQPSYPVMFGECGGGLRRMGRRLPVGRPIPRPCPARVIPSTLTTVLVMVSATFFVSW